MTYLLLLNSHQVHVPANDQLTPLVLALLGIAGMLLLRHAEPFCDPPCNVSGFFPRRLHIAPPSPTPREAKHPNLQVRPADTCNLNAPNEDKGDHECCLVDHKHSPYECRVHTRFATICRLANVDRTCLYRCISHDYESKASILAYQYPHENISLITGTLL